MAGRRGRCSTPNGCWASSRADPCSRILKRRLADRWLARHGNPASTTILVGIDWTEAQRFDDGAGGGIRPRQAARGWQVRAPLCEPPWISRDQAQQALAAAGIAPPRLYGWGFAHNNCGGWCVKAGQGQFARLLERLPHRYAFHEAQEQAFRAAIGRDVAILADRSGDGRKKPLTMAALRRRLAAGGGVDRFEIGGCGCFVDAVADPSALSPSVLPLPPL